jgi:hypothetical protein
MNQVIAHIDISTPIGRKLVKELEKHKKAVRVEYPLPEAISGQKFYTIAEVFSEVEKELNDYYGTNLKLKY